MTEECPACKGKRLIKGKLIEHNFDGKSWFKPDELKRRITFNTPSVLEVERELSACLDCGLVLGRTDAAVARKCIQQLGTAELQKRMHLQT